jgi:hypothetical protein
VAKEDTLAVVLLGCCVTVIASSGTVNVATLDRTVFQPDFSNLARYRLPVSAFVSPVSESDELVCPLTSENVVPPSVETSHWIVGEPAGEVAAEVNDAE